MRIAAPTKEQADKLAQEFLGENDRAAVIVAAARMDVLLEEVLQAYLLPAKHKRDEPDALLGQERPLGSFAARIRLVCRLGLIDQQTEEALHIVRKLRNDFAHEAYAGTFADSPHKERIGKLLSITRLPWGYGTMTPSDAGRTVLGMLVGVLVQLRDTTTRTTTTPAISAVVSSSLEEKP